MAEVSAKSLRANVTLSAKKHFARVHEKGVTSCICMMNDNTYNDVAKAAVMALAAFPRPALVSDSALRIIPL